MLIFLVALSLMGLPVSAQTRGRGFVEAGYGAFTGDKSGSEYQLSASYGTFLNHFFIGGGVGCGYYNVNNLLYDPDYAFPDNYDGLGFFGHIKRFTGVSVPIFLNIKGLWENRRISPDLDLKAGVTAGFVTGLFGEAGAGCRLRLKEKSAILVNAFCKYAYEPGNLITDDSDYMEGLFVDIGFKVAFEF